MAFTLSRRPSRTSGPGPPSACRVDSLGVALMTFCAPTETLLIRRGPSTLFDPKVSDSFQTPLMGLSKDPPLRQHTVARPLPARPKPHLRSVPAKVPTRSVPVVPPDFDGLLRATACRFVAPYSQPWGPPRFLPHVSLRDLSIPEPFAQPSPWRSSYPPKRSPLCQPYRVSTALAFSSSRLLCSLSTTVLPRCSPGPPAPTRPQGFTPAKSPLSAARCCHLAAARCSLGLRSPPGSSPCVRSGVRDADLAACFPSRSSSRRTWNATASLPGETPARSAAPSDHPNPSPKTRARTVTASLTSLELLRKPSIRPKSSLPFPLALQRPSPHTGGFCSTLSVSTHTATSRCASTSEQCFRQPLLPLLVAEEPRLPSQPDRVRKLCPAAPNLPDRSPKHPAPFNCAPAETVSLPSRTPPARCIAAPDKTGWGTFPAAFHPEPKLMVSVNLSDSTAKPCLP